MSFLQKSTFGPGRSVSCQSCGKKVATHWVVIFAGLPAFLGGYVLLKSGSSLIGVAAVAGGLACMALLQTFLVPLVRSET